MGFRGSAVRASVLKAISSHPPREDSLGVGGWGFRILRVEDVRDLDILEFRLLGFRVQFGVRLRAYDCPQPSALNPKPLNLKPKPLSPTPLNL